MNNIKTINMHKTNMVEHPILFQTPMVRAIMNGSKTQTRRILKHKSEVETEVNFDGKIADVGDAETIFDQVKPPYGFVDECMWVREAWQFTGATEDGEYVVYFKDDQRLAFYPGTMEEEDVWMERLEKLLTVMEKKDKVIVDEEEERCTWKKEDVPWKPSIHMPRSIARNFLVVKSVKIERLNDISEEDCIAEGVRFDKDSGYYFVGDEIMGSDPKWVFLQLWESIHGHNSWDKNPWLWVYEFKLLTDWSNG